MNNLDKKTVDTIRLLAVDMIQKANSGHPGLPLGAAPAAYTLFAYHLSQNPKNPKWKNRDRFVLSAGHGSALLYSMLHMFGYGISIDDLKQFRQFNSITTGHPEYGVTPGVETTTGPLGQGIANAVGMAVAETILGAKFNKDGYSVVDHYTYCLTGDGCLMEGVSCEAVSLAGTLGLNKLILIYDSNNITIEGSTDIAFSENVRGRFEAYGWHTILVQDGNDMEAINNAISEAKKSTDKPVLIEVKTKIGYGAPNKEGKSSAHGEPLGFEEIKLLKKNLEWEHEESFFVPADVKEYINEGVKYGAVAEQKWNDMFEEYCRKFPELKAEWDVWHSEKLCVDLINDSEYWDFEKKEIATRSASEIVLQKLAKAIPNLIGGSADLAPSIKSALKGMGDYSKENRLGRNLHYGIREFAMNAIANGIALHGGLINFISGFFVFSDYVKPAARMSALMQLPVIFVFSHDSIGVGEDGPTHQPIEQLAMLRSIPGLTVIRPCDISETHAAYAYALTEKKPCVIVLSRQDIPSVDNSGKGLYKGAYVVKDCENPEMLLIATGSEVSLAVSATDALLEKGVKARVVSMPSWEIFEAQSNEYKNEVLPKSISKRLVIEAASSFGWHKYAGDNGKIMSIDTFGECGPGKELFKHFGYTVENVVDIALKL